MNLLPSHPDGLSRYESSQKKNPTVGLLNPQMLTIAREARSLTQKELSERLNLAQGTISKIEDGLFNPSEDLLVKLEQILGFPRHFFTTQRRVEWSSMGIYRRRTTLPSLLLKRCEAQMTILKMNISQLLSAAEPIDQRLPLLDPEENGGAKRIAQLVRLSFQLPPGPIRNLTEIVEAAGCIIISFDFGTRKIDACSVHIGDIPVIFVNHCLNAVRYRFTIAHELGHLVMHRTVSDAVEDKEQQANRFASELLMPEAEIKPSLLPINIDRLARHKLRWRVSMQAILYHAKSMAVINDRTHRYYSCMINRLGYREVEPHDGDIPKESPSLLRDLIDMHLQDLSTTTFKLAQELGISESDFAIWFLGRPSIRVI